MRTKTIILIVLLAMSVGLYSQEGTRAAIQGKNGDNWVLDKGTADGVAVGLKGYFWTSKKSGDKWYSLKIARFHVAKVEDKQCQVKVEDASEGFSEMEYQWATFMGILKAPTPRSQTPDAKPKVEKPVDNQPNLELAFWEAIKDSKNVDDFKEYLVKYPNGTFSGLVKNRIKSLETSSQADAELAATRAAEEQRQAEENKRQEAKEARLAEEQRQRQVEEAKSAAERARFYIEMVAIPKKNYSIGKYEVTQGQWQAVMGSKTSEFQKRDNYPMEKVSWDDCQAFIQRLNEKTGKNYRLPTELEWVYACQAGTTGNRYGIIDAIAWYRGNSASSTHSVGEKQPNAFGLHDMLGNVWEWCQDLHDSSGLYRVVRGGGWIIDARRVRSALRLGISPGSCIFNLGFRLASSSASR